MKVPGTPIYQGVHKTPLFLMVLALAGSVLRVTVWGLKSGLEAGSNQEFINSKLAWCGMKIPWREEVFSLV